MDSESPDMAGEPFLSVTVLKNLFSLRLDRIVVLVW